MSRRDDEDGPRIIRPHRGPQTDFLASGADFTLYGGGRGSGKTYSLTVDPLRHVHVPGYRAKIFRKNFNDLMDVGGVWLEAMDIYPNLASPGLPNLSLHHFIWPSPVRARIAFGHFQDQRASKNVQGKQFDRTMVDELPQLEEDDFWKLMQATRSSSHRIRPVMKTTCNPPGSKSHWLYQFAEPFLDCNGYPDRTKTGKVKWFRRAEGNSGGIEWVPEGTPFAMSFRFIPALLSDNPTLTERDPTYETKLMNLVSWERDQMLHGNWHAAPRKGLFRREQFKVIDAVPGDLTQLVRYWDQAGTEPSPSNPNPDYTAGALVGYWPARNAMVIVDMRRFRTGPAEKRQRMRATADADGKHVRIRVEQEPAASGKDVVLRLQTEDLRGYRVEIDRPIGDKSTRASPWLAWLECGNVYVVRGAWNGEFFEEVESWPSKKMDQIDAVSGGFASIVAKPTTTGSSPNRPRRAKKRIVA